MKTRKRAMGYGEWVEEVYAYEGYFGNPARCGLRIFFPAGKLPVVIVTELIDNPGTSITNMAEHLAARIAQERGLVRFVWVEHWFATPALRIPEHFSIVKFTCEDATLREPAWRPLPEAELRRMIA